MPYSIISQNGVVLKHNPATDAFEEDITQGLPFAHQWIMGLTVAGTEFLAVTQDGVVCVTENRITWKRVKIPWHLQMESVFVTSAGTWLIGATDMNDGYTPYFLRSVDQGITWTRTIPSGANYGRVAFAFAQQGSNIVAVGGKESSQFISTTFGIWNSSNDGVTFTTDYDLNVTNFINRVKNIYWTGTDYCCFDQLSNWLLRRIGTTWTEQALPAIGLLTDTKGIYYESKWVFARGLYVDYTCGIYSTTDFVTFTHHPITYVEPAGSNRYVQGFYLNGTALRCVTYSREIYEFTSLAATGTYINQVIPQRVGFVAQSDTTICFANQRMVADYYAGISFDIARRGETWVSTDAGATVTQISSSPIILDAVLYQGKWVSLMADSYTGNPNGGRSKTIWVSTLFGVNPSIITIPEPSTGYLADGYVKIMEQDGSLVFLPGTDTTWGGVTSYPVIAQMTGVSSPVWDVRMAFWGGSSGTASENIRGFAVDSTGVSVTMAIAENHQYYITRTSATTATQIRLPAESLVGTGYAVDATDINKFRGGMAYGQGKFFILERAMEVGTSNEYLAVWSSADGTTWAGVKLTVPIATYHNYCFIQADLGQVYLLVNPSNVTSGRVYKYDTGTSTFVLWKYCNTLNYNTPCFVARDSDQLAAIQPGGRFAIIEVEIGNTELFLLGTNETYWYPTSGAFVKEQYLVFGSTAKYKAYKWNGSTYVAFTPTENANYSLPAYFFKYSGSIYRISSSSASTTIIHLCRLIADVWTLVATLTVYRGIFVYGELRCFFDGVNNKLYIANVNPSYVNFATSVVVDMATLGVTVTPKVLLYLLSSTTTRAFYNNPTATDTYINGAINFSSDQGMIQKEHGDRTWFERLSVDLYYNLTYQESNASWYADENTVYNNSIVRSTDLINWTSVPITAGHIPTSTGFSWPVHSLGGTKLIRHWNDSASFTAIRGFSYSLDNGAVWNHKVLTGSPRNPVSYANGSYSTPAMACVAGGRGWLMSPHATFKLDLEDNLAFTIQRQSTSFQNPLRLQYVEGLPVSVEINVPAPLLESFSGAITTLGVVSPVLTATGNSNDNAQVILNLPSPLLSAFTGMQCRLPIPAPVLVSSGTVPGYGVVALEIPAPELLITAFIENIATFIIELPDPIFQAASGAVVNLNTLAPILTITGSVEHLAWAALTIPAPELIVTGKVGTIATVLFTLPVPTFESTVLVGSIANVVLTLPAIILTANNNAVVNETTYAINLNTGAVTSLFLGEITRLVSAHGKLYGLKGTELIRLGGESDGDEDIQTTVRFASQTFDTNVTKRMSAVYVSGRENDGIILDIVEDEKTTWSYQTDTDHSQAFGTHRVKVGRGIKFHTAGLIIKNRNGGKLDIGSIELLIDTSTRRPKT
jgi:hypothetical protein